MSEETVKRRRRSTKAPEEGVKEDALQQQKEEGNGQKTEEGVLIPYPHRLLKYVGPEDAGKTPTFNRYVYPKGRAVAIPEKDAVRILARFGDQFIEA